MRALVLSGGGSKGAYQVGALQWLLRNKAYKYDLLCGVSVGALNSAILSMHEIGQEKAAAQALTNIWQNISDEKIFKEHLPFGRLMSFWRSSVVNSTPLHNLIDSKYDPVKTINAKRKLIVGAVSLTTGAYTEFTEEDALIKQAIKASSAYPVFFTPVRFNNQVWSDGGIRTITPIEAAIRAGATEIHAIVAGPANSTRWPNYDPTALDIALRTLELTYEEIMDEDLDLCVRRHSKVKITILRPGKELPGSSVSFDNKNRIVMEELGYKDAQITWP